MTLLASLPQSIIDSILDAEMSACVIKLWICGDRSMQHKISTGVTTIKLVDRREFTLSRFPKFIEELHVLRELTIDRAGQTMPYYRNIPQHIQQLPPTLKKLIIRVTNSHRIIAPPTLTDASILPLSTQIPAINGLNHLQWTLAGAFSQLETLELHFAEKWDYRALTLLPQSLTSLTMIESPKYASQDRSPSEPVDKTFSSSLPRNLLDLHITPQYATFTSCFWTHLPPHLTKITACTKNTTETGSVSSLLPRSLTHIKANFKSLDLTGLPPNLNNLSFHWIKPSDLEQLPPLSQIFSLGSLTPQILGLLPSSIHTIEAYSIMDGISTDEWPASLTTLSLNAPINDNMLLQLPSTGITKLSLSTISSIYTSCITLLPRSLQHIEFAGRTLRGYDAADLVYPPGLTFLSISTVRDYEAGCFDIRNIPASLTHLKVSVGILASQLTMLPPRLKHFEARTLRVPGFDCSSKIEIEAMRLNFANGAAQGIEEAFDSNQLDRASIFALLPRTLTHLHVGRTDMDCDTLGWRMVPPLLENLTCKSSEGLPVIFLDIMPKTLHSIDLNLRSVENHHLQLLPRYFRTLKLKCLDSPTLTMMALQYAPAACGLHLNDMRFHSFHRALHERSNDEDPSFFLQLLSPTKKFLKKHFDCE